MKKENREKIEYIDEFRKISTLEKLPPLPDKLHGLFEDEAQKENNNFIRLRKEPQIDRWDNREHQQIILHNECVEGTVHNKLKEETDDYTNYDLKVKNDMQLFKEWSNFNKNVEKKNQTFKFYYRHASPPQKNANNSPRENYNNKKTYNENENQYEREEYANDIDFFNIGGQKHKYDFFLINQKRIEQFEEKPAEKHKVNENEKEEQNIFNQAFRKFDKYKTLESISAIDEYKMSEDSFTYDLNNREEIQIKNKLDDYMIKKFIYKSVAKSLKNTEKDIEYFRDIGLPSRCLDKYSEALALTNKKSKELFEEETKEQAHFLHLLRESELHINKGAINFDDISNIATGRVTSQNANMCIRSEKITKAQFNQLLNKLDKYKRQEKEKGKEKIEIGVWTEDIELEINNNAKAATNEELNEINQIVNEIGSIRQSAVTLDSDGKPNLSIKDYAFNKEKYTRILFLLKRLYDKIVVDSVQYPLILVEDYLDNVQEILLPEYQDGKLLWFVLDCYEQIIRNLPDEDNIKTVLKRKPVNEPIVSHFKEKKLLREHKIKSNHLYTYVDKSQKVQKVVPTKDKTPVKSVTPRKKHSPSKPTTPAKTVQKKPTFHHPGIFSNR